MDHVARKPMNPEGRPTAESHRRAEAVARTLTAVTLDAQRRLDTAESAAIAEAEAIVAADAR